MWNIATQKLRFTASKLSQTLAQTKWLRTTPCLRNIKQFGKKIHNHVPFDINSSKRPSSFCLYGRNMPSKCNEFGMDPRIIVLFDSPKLSYEEALKFCPHGLCKFHFFLFISTKKLRGSIDGCRPVSNWLWQIRRIRTFQWSTCLDKHRIRDPRTAWYMDQSHFSLFKLDFGRWMWMRSSLDFCIERFNKTHFKSDGKIFVLEEYFNAEPVNSPNGEWQLFPDALKLDLKDNASLLNSWSHEPGESL